MEEEDGEDHLGQQCCKTEYEATKGRAAKRAEKGEQGGRGELKWRKVWQGRKKHDNRDYQYCCHKVVQFCHVSTNDYFV